MYHSAMLQTTVAVMLLAVQQNSNTFIYRVLWVISQDDTQKERKQNKEIKTIYPLECCRAVPR